MRSCLRIPRLFVPVKKNFSRWAVPSPEEGSELDWERVASETGGAPSSLSLVLPDAKCAAAGEEELRAISDAQYRALWEGVLERLNRGCMLVERTGSCKRRGILCLVDLEEVSESGKEGTARALREPDGARVEKRLALRKGSVLEFPHTVLCYRDKKDKLMSALEGEDLELVYEAPAGGGTVKGYFLPDFLSAEVIRDLMGKADPCFGVLAGEDDLFAAKRFWESCKTGLSLSESRNHPARYALAEFVNLLSEDVIFSAGAPEKSELLSMLKGGKHYPIRAFSLLHGRDIFEGREISYD